MEEEDKKEVEAAVEKPEDINIDITETVGSSGNLS